MPLAVPDSARRAPRLTATAMILVCLMGCSSEPQAIEDAPIRQGSNPGGEHAATTAAKSGRSRLKLQPSSRPKTLVNNLADLANPGQDDWDTERQTKVAQDRLATVAELVMEERLDDANLSAIVSSTLVCRYPDRDSFEVIHEDRDFRIRRSVAGETNSKTVTGFAGFRRLVTAWTEHDSVPGPLHLKFKLFRIEPTREGFRTQSYLEITKQKDSISSQIDLECHCQWRGIGTDVQLTSLVIANSRSAQVRAPNGQLFVDCTRTVMQNTDAYRQQVVPGIPYWTRRIGREFMGQFGHHGLAVGDVNGDGLDDIYACDTGGLPNRLYVQTADGTILDVSRQSGVDLLEESLGALLIDLDNDGDQDLVVVCDPFVQFAENDGQGNFQRQPPIMVETDGYSLSAADFDQDGDLDIYVCGYNARRQDAIHRGLPFPLPYHDANNGGRNYLLRNEGGFRFVDVTEDVGLDVDNRRFSLAAAWEDYDNDGDQDLYVANDFGRNCLYQNHEGTFVNVAAAAGVEDHASGMSVSWGDFDRDGLMDIYVSNMFSAAGNRVTFQRRFGDGIAQQTLADIQRMARGNTLFRNRGDGTFEDVSAAANVTQGRWAWGSRFTDLNNDGWQDLVVANGYITNEDSSDL